MAQSRKESLRKRKLYREKNKERLSIERKSYYQENKHKESAVNKIWCANNPEKVKAAKKRYRLIHPDRCLNQYLAWRENNKDTAHVIEQRYRDLNRIKVRKRITIWAKNNPDKLSSKQAKRRSIKLKAYPLWADLEKINKIYYESKLRTVETGISHHVDHIIPLLGKYVCGLHVENNLQILTARENLVKSNSFIN